MGKLDQSAVCGVGDAFYCSRVRAYMTKAECLSAYKFALEKCDYGAPCVECSKVWIWKKNQNTIKKRNPRTARIPQQIQEESIMAVKKNNAEEMVDLVVDFTGRPDLMQGLRASAKENFRTPEQQLLFLIHNHVLGKKAHAKKGA